MIDHIGIIVTDFANSRAFYENALARSGMPRPR
ncbi:VOC family protein [Pseudoduganella umbonata]|uniref:Catechol 2,3-dioxygenase-like lactoylglutathione lyase family enzyme n=1 Tax=Pseudoduganella umbonata TaxID=864828 RepID=A0A7W5HEL8_9BURK|nr:catechol 2,3-dioxygenase-like lactoylglutathione lyase family enzyme [Pseudoduganella umbonata]